MAEGDPDGIRPTTIGPFSSRAETGNKPRVVPVPWIDCGACGWRHYPSLAGGRWHIATVCAGCGVALELPEEVDVVPPPAR